MAKKDVAIFNASLQVEMVKLETQLASAALVIKALVLAGGGKVSITPEQYDTAIWQIMKYELDEETGVSTITLEPAPKQEDNTTSDEGLETQQNQGS